MPGKVNSLKDKLEDNQLDLSLMQLTEVPVKEISELTKGTHLDLSNNLLTWLPENFPTLTHIIHLDLSKNQLTELPEYFGQLKSLRHLDLYSNQLKRLPVSFCQLKNLKWLDLKNNPLDSALAKAAGPCITPADCATCAKKVVALLQSVQSHQERLHQKLLADQRALAQQRLQLEEEEKAKLKAEKKAAKEKRKQDNRMREEAARKKAEVEAMASMRHEMEQSPRAKVDNAAVYDKQAKTGCCYSIFMSIMALALLTMGFGVSLVWIYTNGHLDQRSIERALPIIQKDVDVTLVEWSKKADKWLESSKPYTKQARDTAHWLWEEFKARNDIVAHKINTHMGPYVCSAKSALFEGWKRAQVEANKAWTWARPHLSHIGDYVITYAKMAWKWMEANVPVYMSMAYDKCLQVSNYLQTTVSNALN